MLPGRAYDFERIAAIAWSRRWLVVTPLLAGTVVAYLIAARLPNQYRSETSILVVPQRVPESYVRSTVTARIEDRLRSITQQVRSRTRLEQIIKEFNLYPEERTTLGMESAVAQMRDDIELETVRADSFRLAFVYTEPETAMSVTERLAGLYIEENVRDREVLAEGTNKFLEAQLDDARRRLLEQEKRIEEYRLQHSGELPSQLPTNLQVIQNAQLQIQSVLESVNRDRDRRSIVDRLIADTSPVVLRVESPQPSNADPAPLSGRSAAEQLTTATAHLASLERRFRPEHPDVIRWKRVITDLREKAKLEDAAQAPGAAPPPVMSAVEAARQRQLSGLQAERDSLDRQITGGLQEEKRLREMIKEYQVRVEMVPKRESEMIGLTRDYDTLQQAYRTLLGKKEESQLSANLERQQRGEQFRVLDPARLPEAPFSPNRPLIIGMGAFLGLMLGVGLAALLNFLDSSMHSDEDVIGALNLPVLAVVPLVKSDSNKSPGRLMLVLAVVSLLTIGGLAAAWTLIH